MCKFSKKLIYLLFALVLFIPSVKADDSKIPVRVGISNTNFKTYLFDNISFLDAKNMEVMDASSGYTIPISETAEKIEVTNENNLLRVYVDNVLLAKNLEGPVLIRPKEGHLVSIEGLKRKGTQASYRGFVEIVRSSKDISKFSIVNVLSLKNYLRGVVPNEMPVRFGLEALKAQTVAARNYAVTPRIRAFEEFDVCDSVACQVYFGANTEDTLSDEAIEKTNGIVALDNEDKPILALYSSTAGGYTESYEYAFSDPETKSFPSKEIHYLSSVPDNRIFEPLNTEEKALEFYTTKPEAFDDASPYYRWSKEWNKSELEDVLKKTMIAQSKTGFIKPELTSSSDFGNLISIIPLKRGNSGKIVELEIKTDKNTFIVQKELVIRRCFQKNGISLPSANFVISQIDAQTPVYKFNGGGFGHGVGLSQWGAGKMASLGFSYDRILQHYYQGIKLATMPFNVYANFKIQEKVFYSENEDAFLLIKNPCGLDKLKIIVNNKELVIKLKKEEVKTDISKYLNEGENRISFIIMDENADMSSYIEVHAVIKEAEDCNE